MVAEDFVRDPEMSIQNNSRSLRKTTPSISLYQIAETLTHLCHRRVRAPRPYPIGPPYVFAMNVRVGRSQHESGSASFGIMPVERRGQVTDVGSEPTGNRRSSNSQRKAAAFVRWHEPDDARVSSPDL